jgi:long-chain fatty acid transport protein
MRGSTSQSLGVLLILAAFILPRGALAAGFYIQEQSAAGVGRAQAGNVVAADDASTIYFNPAGMTELPGVQFDSGIDLIVPSASLSNLGTVDHTPYVPSVPDSGNNGGNPGSASPVPDFYLTAEIPESPMTVGLGVTAPFGFASKFTQGTFTRYDSIDSFVETIDIAPTIAVKLNDWLSVGLGLDEQYVYIKLRNALPDPFGIPSPSTDGRLTLTGHNWSTGFNAGVLVMPGPDTKIGLSYRYGITHNINGSVTLSGLPGPLAAGDVNEGGAAALNLPDIITAGASQQITPNLKILGEFDYYNWSVFKSIDIVLANNGGSLITPENYRNTVSVALGGEYQLNNQWKIRGGIKYDQTPTVNGSRDTRVPDGDRYWVAAGVHYAFSEHIGIDASYAHIFVTDSSVNVSRSFYQQYGLTTTSMIEAESHVALDILTLGLTYKF